MDAEPEDVPREARESAFAPDNRGNPWRGLYRVVSTPLEAAAVKAGVPYYLTEPVFYLAGSADVSPDFVVEG